VPLEVQGDDEASAKAFVRYYCEVLSAAMVTGGTSDLDALALPRCLTCRNFSALIRDTYDKGGHYETKGWAVQAAVSLTWSGAHQAFGLRTQQEDENPLRSEHQACPSKQVRDHAHASDRRAESRSLAHGAAGGDPMSWA